MTNNHNAPPNEEALESEIAHKADMATAREDSKRKLYFGLAALLGLAVLFGLMRLGNLSGMGSGQGVTCSPHYTSCVLDCNKQSVELSQKSQNSFSPVTREKWERRLQQVQSYCIPACYQTHCQGPSRKVASHRTKQKLPK